VRLAARERALGGVPVHETSESGADIAATARRLAADHSPVIIDTAGFRAPSTLAALAAANLVLVPVKPSPLDVDVMLDTARALFHTADGKVPRFYCLLTQTTRDSVIARHIRSELMEAGLLDSELINRVGYGEVALFGATPSLLDPRVSRGYRRPGHEIENLLETAMSKHPPSQPEHAE
jgi:chromosome partitioning protein